MDKTEIKNAIMRNRSNLKDNTVKSYVSTLFSLYKQVFPNDKEIILSKYQDTDKFIDYLIKHYDSSVRKTYLSNLVVLTENDIYRTQMMEDVATAQEEKSNNEMTEKLLKNQVTKKEIDTLIHLLKDEVKLIYKNQSYTPKNLLTIQNYILLNLFVGKYISPRRSMDYWKFRVRNIDEKNDNYLDGDEIVFTSYKTSFSYGTQRIKVPTPLLRMLKKYIAVIPPDQNYLFFTVSGKPLNSVLLNQRFNAIFGNRHVSVNSLRHAYLSEKYQSFIDLKQDFQRMGSSMLNADAYIQRLK